MLLSRGAARGRRPAPRSSWKLQGARARASAVDQQGPYPPSERADVILSKKLAAYRLPHLLYDPSSRSLLQL